MTETRRSWCCQTPITGPHVDDCLFQPRDPEASLDRRTRACGCSFDTEHRHDCLRDGLGSIIRVDGVSWLGTWKDNGWSLRITPRLSEKEFEVLSRFVDDTYNPEIKNYDVNKALVLLRNLFGDHYVYITVPPVQKEE